MVNAECPSEKDAAEGALDNVLSRKYVDELYKDKLFGITVKKDEGTLSEAELREELGDPAGGVKAERVGPGNKGERLLRSFEGAEGKSHKDGLMDEDGGIPDGDFVSLREAVFDGDVASDDECGAEQFQTDVCERGGGVIERKVFQRDADERPERLYAQTENDGDGFGRKKIVRKKETGVRTGARVSVCDDEVGEEDVSLITEKTRLTGRRKKSMKERRWKRWLEMGSQGSVELELLLVLTVPRCVGGLRLEVLR